MAKQRDNHRRTAGRACPRLVLVAGILAAAACGGSGRGELILIDGSSTVFPVTAAVAEEFMRTTAGVVNVAVGISGTGFGFELFCTGETDISNASRPMGPDEEALCIEHGITGTEFPIAYDGITVVVHPDNDFVECLTTQELRRIWQPGSGVRTWADVRPEWPAEPIRLYGPGIDSGTFDFFTEAIVGDPGASRPDYFESEDDDSLVQGVAGDPNALGYFRYAYYAANRDWLRLVAVDGGRGCVRPSPATILDQSYTPLSRTLFLYVSARALRRPAVLDFLRFYMEVAPELVPEVGYVPLDAPQYGIHIRRLESLAGR